MYADKLQDIDIILELISRGNFFIRSASGNCPKLPVPADIPVTFVKDPDSHSPHTDTSNNIENIFYKQDRILHPFLHTGLELKNRKKKKKAYTPLYGL